MPTPQIRPETPQDIAAIRLVNQEAFGRLAEAGLVQALRSNDRITLSLVALVEGQIVGHILFFPLSIESETASYATLGLGPMAVLPAWQKQGIGSALVRAGLEQLRGSGPPGVIVLGHPEFYPRFGFTAASNFGIQCPFEVPNEAFMAVELEPGALVGKGGMVVYTAEFAEV